MRAYFGGSFNPPHVGHHQILMSLLKRKEIEAVHIVPSSQNPLKKMPDDFTLSFEDRWRLSQAWVTELPEALRSRVVLESIEIDAARRAKKEVTSYTVDTLAKLRKLYGESRWALVIGEDILAQLHKWKNVDALLKSVEKVILFQRGVSGQAPTIPAAFSKLVTFDVLMDRIKDVSSTEIRKELGDHQISETKLVPAVRQVLKAL